MGIFRGLTRRRFMQSAAMGAGALAGGRGLFAPRTARAQDYSFLTPPNGRFNNVELTYFQDTNWLHAPLWLSPHFQEHAGVSIASREQYDGGDTVARVLPQLLSRRPRFDFVQFPSLFFGAFAETGTLEPLDAYFDQYEGAQDYLDWVMPAYGEFYTKWNGQRYGIMLDGDIHILHYRRNYFEDPTLRDRFSSRFQRELEVPRTWPHFLETTQFFTEELADQGVYGTSMVVSPPNFSWGFWMNIAASNGVVYFDENMNPQINTPAAVEALDMFREIIRFGPPGAEAMDLAQTIQRWQSGADVMSIWWIDLAEFTVQQQGLELAEQQGAAIVPGWQQPDGSIRHRAMSLWCRTGSIPAAIPDEAKQAAFHYLYHLSHPRISDEIVADEYCGSDPFGASHYTDAAAEKYTQPNPQRGTDNDLWPTNAGIFSTFQRARDHLDGALANVEVGFPQFYWEGTPELADALGRNISRAVVGDLTSQQALDEAAEEWVQIVQRLGIDSQRSQYQNFVNGARALGYQI